MNEHEHIVVYVGKEIPGTGRLTIIASVWRADDDGWHSEGVSILEKPGGEASLSWVAEPFGCNWDESPEYVANGVVNAISTPLRKQYYERAGHTTSVFPEAIQVADVQQAINHMCTVCDVGQMNRIAGRTGNRKLRDAIDVALGQSGKP